MVRVPLYPHSMKACSDRALYRGLPPEETHTVRDGSSSVNEWVEAKHQLQLRRALARWSRYHLIVIDDVGYVSLGDIGAEVLFQVMAERTEKAVVIITTNLPLSDWMQVIPNARLCRALQDGVADRTHILHPDTESYRFRQTAAKRTRPAKTAECNKD